jgi:hypothetical protein
VESAKTKWNANADEPCLKGANPQNGLPHMKSMTGGAPAATTTELECA